METSSVASGNTSLNSVPEEDEELLDMSSTSPRTLQHDSLKTGMVTDHLASTMPTRGHATAFEEGEGDTGFGRKEAAQASGSKAVFAAGGDRGEAGHEDVRAMRAMLQASAQETKQKLHDTGLVSPHCRAPDTLAKHGKRRPSKAKAAPIEQASDNEPRCALLQKRSWWPRAKKRRGSGRRLRAWKRTWRTLCGCRRSSCRKTSMLRPNSKRCSARSTEAPCATMLTLIKLIHS